MVPCGVSPVTRFALASARAKNEAPEEEAVIMKLITRFSICFLCRFKFFLQLLIMHIISATDFPLFCSNSARKCLVLPAEFIQAYQKKQTY